MRQNTFFCNACGEKIEETERSTTDGGRFCGVCRQDFLWQAYGLKLVAGAAFLIGLFGLGSLWRGGEKPLNVAARQIVVSPVNQNKSDGNKPAPVSTSAAVPVNSAQKNRTQTANTFPKQTPDAPAAEPAVYFCGALTKKGTSCTRRVRGGGRCWQHRGQTPPPPPEKSPSKR